MELVIRLVAAFLMVLLASIEVPAAEPYLGLEGQANLPQNTDQSDSIEAGSEATFGGALTMGYAFSPVFALEGQLGHRSSNLHGVNGVPHPHPGAKPGLSAEGDVTLKYLAANVRLSLPTPYVQPYVLGGLVGGHEEQDGRTPLTGREWHDSGLEAGYQLGAGVRVPLGRVTLDLGARYFEAGEIEHLGATIGLAVSLGDFPGA